MKKILIFTILAIFVNIPIISQPGSGRGFTLYHDLVYVKHGSCSLQLDLYTPDGTAMTGGIGVGSKETISTSILSVDEKPPVPVLLWIPVEGTDKFPTPIAGFVGNGYAVASIEVESNFRKA